MLFLRRSLKFSVFCKSKQSFSEIYRVFKMASNENLTYLNNDVVAECLKGQWSNLVALIEKGLKSFSEGKVEQPVRTVVDVKKYEGDLDAMLAYDTETETLAIKVLTSYTKNADKDLPTTQAIVLLYSATDGCLKAIMEGNEITNMRTAAASMVATKYLARKDSKCAAILGAGKQGLSHYQGTKHFYDIKKFLVWDVNKEMGSKLVERIKSEGTEAEFCSSVEVAVKEADIINVATFATKPILKKKWVKDGAHINAVGAVDEDKQELEEDLVLSSVVYVDSIDAAKKESGDIIKSGVEVYAEIGEVVSGKKEAFPDKTTIFKSVGIAIEDAVTAKLVYENYTK